MVRCESSPRRPSIGRQSRAMMAPQPRPLHTTRRARQQQPQLGWGGDVISTRYHIRTMTEHRCSVCGKSKRDKRVTNPALRALGWTPLRLGEFKMVAGPIGTARTVSGGRIDHGPMHGSYVALPHQLTMRGWMVFHRSDCRPVASKLTPSQARTLAATLNLVATGEAPRSARPYGNPLLDRQPERRRTPRLRRGSPRHTETI